MRNGPLVYRMAGAVRAARQGLRSLGALGILLACAAGALVACGGDGGSTGDVVKADPHEGDLVLSPARDNGAAHRPAQRVRRPARRLGQFVRFGRMRALAAAPVTGGRRLLIPVHAYPMHVGMTR